MERTPLGNIIVIVSFFKTECSRRDQIRQTKHPNVLSYQSISHGATTISDGIFSDTSSGLDGGGSTEAGMKDVGGCASIVTALAHLKLVSRHYFTAKHIPSPHQQCTSDFTSSLLAYNAK